MQYLIIHAYTDEILATVEAPDAAGALDQYAVNEGFAPYSEIAKEDPSFAPYEHNGLLHAVMTNYEIKAQPQGSAVVVDP